MRLDRVPGPGPTGKGGPARRVQPAAGGGGGGAGGAAVLAEERKLKGAVETVFDRFLDQYVTMFWPL